MKVRPSAVYRNVGCMIGICLVFYFIYFIIGYDDNSHIDTHHRQKHLYLTVSKDSITPFNTMNPVQNSNWGRNYTGIGHRFGKLSPKWILMWTKVFGESKAGDLSDCKGYSDRCIITSNKSLVSVADAVVFHARDIRETPFPSPRDRRSHQRYVFMTMETPSNSGRHAVPLNFFNWTATYLLSSDVVYKYGPYYLTSKEAEEKGLKLANLYAEDYFPKKKAGIFGLISNCNTTAKREVALLELSRYINVTIGGKCAVSSSSVGICPRDSDCSDLYGQYPFYFAVENSVCKDYITEKYWDKISIPSIPIVMRRKIYETSPMPPHSFIAMDDYISPKEMATHLKSLESDKNAYAEYFMWRRGGWTVAPWNAPGYRNQHCRLCEKLWEENQENKVIEDVWAWFDAESQCEGDDFVRSWIKN